MDNVNSQLYMLFDLAPPHIITFLEALVASYQLEGVIHLLDIGCGPGRLLRPVAELGWHVTGMEPNAAYLQQAQAIAQTSDQITVYQGGFGDISTRETYHLIAAINAPFAYLLTHEARHDALQRCFQALRPAGVLFIEIPNFLYRLKAYRPAQDAIITTENGQIARRVIKHEIDWHHATWTHIDQFYLDDVLQSTQIHRMAIITIPELLRLITEVGFHMIRTYNSYASRHSQAIQGERILVSAQKPSPAVY